MKLYPWDRWFKRGRFTLRRYHDYFCSPYSMGQQIRNAASRRGIKVKVKASNYDMFTITVKR